MLAQAVAGCTSSTLTSSDQAELSAAGATIADAGCSTDSSETSPSPSPEPSPSPGASLSPGASPSPSPSPPVLDAPTGLWLPSVVSGSYYLNLIIVTNFEAHSVSCVLVGDSGPISTIERDFNEPALQTAFSVTIDYPTFDDLSAVACSATDANGDVSPFGYLAVNG